MAVRHYLAAVAFLIVVTSGSGQMMAQSEITEDRIKEITAQHRTVASIRAIEYISREMYFVQSVILLNLHGNRTEYLGTYNQPARGLTQAVDARFLPPLRRFRARLDGLSVSVEQKRALSDALTELDVSIEAGYAMAEFLRSDDLAGATDAFYGTSLPAFKSAWQDIYTVITELERAIPKR